MHTVGNENGGECVQWGMCIVGMSMVGSLYNGDLVGRLWGSLDTGEDIWLGLRMVGGTHGGECLWWGMPVVGNAYAGECYGGEWLMRL